MCQQKGSVSVTKVMTVMKTKKMVQTTKKKGELMQNDQDAMEVHTTSVSSHQNKHKSYLYVNISDKVICVLNCT